MLRFFLFILLLLWVNNAIAQPLDNQNVRFGIRAGMNFSSMNFVDDSLPSEISNEATWKSGGVVGLFMIVPLYGSFYIQPEYLYSQMGGITKSPQTKFEYNYLSMPVFLRWQAGQRFSLLLGPQFDLLINAKQKNGESIEVITEELEDRSIGATFGVEISLGQSFLVGIRYMRGINEIDYFRIPENQEFKYEMLQVSIGYIF